MKKKNLRQSPLRWQKKQQPSAPRVKLYFYDKDI